MRLTQLLHSLGDKLGILEKVHEAAPEQRRVRTRTVTLAELTAEIRAAEVKKLAEAPAELSIPFEQIFEAAGIKAGPKGWTIQRLRGVLETAVVGNSSPEQAQRTVLNILEAEGVTAEDLIRDAVSRDQALDAFEKFAGKKLDERVSLRARRIAEIEPRIDELQREKRHLEEQSRNEQEQWRAWLRKKRAQERELASAAAYLIDRDVVTTEPDPEPRT